jgi:hypothetical protein
VRAIWPSLKRLIRPAPRPRVLYFIVNYPTFSETYMQEEMRSLRDRYDMEIITYKDGDLPRLHPYPYHLIKYQDSCFVYGPIEKVNRDFGNPAQLEFIGKIDEVIARFAPDVMHGHYFGMALLLRRLAERHRIPFTIRTHSQDILSEPAAKLAANADACNSPWCRRVLAFPAFRHRLIESGLVSSKVVDCWPVVNFARFHKPERRPPTGGVICAGPAIAKKAHVQFVEIAALLRGSNLFFELFTQGDTVPATEARNAELGHPIRINYADPDDMPSVYPRFDWIVYPADLGINRVGFPCAIAEAMASGLGVCMQELPGRREEQLAFLGGAGFLFKSIEELPAILTKPYPEEKRRLGFEAARRCDIEGHKGLLSEAWDEAVQQRASR